MTDFIPFPKIPRLRRDCVISEKIDGTNAAVNIVDYEGDDRYCALIDGKAIYAQSRKRIITPQDDNFGFASWVAQNAPSLAGLGDGCHFGEWWGVGIQRSYGLKERRFSLFNTSRWDDNDARPSCCGVVPALYSGTFSTESVDYVIECLRSNGSVAAPGFMKPEGVVVYHVAAGEYFKVLLENDEVAKGFAA